MMRKLGEFSNGVWVLMSWVRGLPGEDMNVYSKWNESRLDVHLFPVEAQ